MQPPTSETLIAILPDAAPHREQIARAVTQANGTSVGLGKIAEAAVAIVDLTAANDVQLPEPRGFPVLVILDPADTSMVARALELGAVNFVSPSAIALELPYRLRQVLQTDRLLESLRGQTEREKQTRVAAQQRAADLERYEEYFARVSDGIAVLDQRGQVLSLNPAGAQLLGIAAEQGHGRHIQAVANPSDDLVLIDVLGSISRGEPLHDVDLRIRSPQGRALTLSVSAAPLEQGGAILSFRDVTAARQLAGELKQTKDFLERLINSSVDAIIAADMRGKIILFNKGAEDIAGYSSEEALKKLNVKDLYPPGVARQVMAQLRDPQIRARGRLGVCRQDIVSKRGERVPVNMTASIIYEGERETATVGIFTDLRDRMQLERKLSDAETRLEESEKTAVIVELAGTAAHELNQPLTSVMGYADLLKRKLKEDDFAYRPVDIIYREAERMAEIVRKIGKITRYETKSYIGTAKILDLDKASSHED
ncbi:MAG TPA: PAS domain S-box protein [Myxococcaceae bacterium]|nr:PAS domain S-box protein [Myxococcaceae bacterium]